MNKGPISTKELQTTLTFKTNENIKSNQIPLSSETPQIYFETSTHLQKCFSGKKLF